MPGKSLKGYHPPPPEEVNSNASDLDDSPLSSDGGQENLTAGSFDDHLLEEPVEESQIPDAGCLYTQIPQFPPSQSNADDEETPNPTESTQSYQSKDIVRWIEKKDKKAHVSQLHWDKQRQLGQIRTLNTVLVDHYLNRICKQPPRRPIRILAKATAGLLTYHRVGVS